MTLETFTADTFKGGVGEVFVLDLDGHAALELTLIECSVFDSIPVPPNRRVPFSLLFRGPLDRQLPQATYTLRHPTLGTFPLFIVPTAREADGMRYEAVFG